MMRSLREAGNGLISGYKKAEEVARKKVVTEVSGFSVPRCRFALDGISASLQHVSATMFLFPDTET